MNTALPGHELVEEGLKDLREGEDSLSALLVSMAVERLEDLGFDVAEPIESPEEKFYRRLEEQFGDGAHSKYNAYRRQLVSFLRAASCARKSRPSESSAS